MSVGGKLPATDSSRLKMGAIEIGIAAGLKPITVLRAVKTGAV
jgi:hypothetical protein